jgi:hypothetical protein
MQPTGKLCFLRAHYESTSTARLRSNLKISFIKRQNLCPCTVNSSNIQHYWKHVVFVWQAQTLFRPCSCRSTFHRNTMYGKMTRVLLVELFNLGDVDLHVVEIVGKRQHCTRENFLESLCTRKVSAQTREVKLV